MNHNSTLKGRNFQLQQQTLQPTIAPLKESRTKAGSVFRDESADLALNQLSTHANEFMTGEARGVANPLRPNNTKGLPDGFYASSQIQS